MKEDDIDRHAGKLKKCRGRPRKHAVWATVEVEQHVGEVRYHNDYCTIDLRPDLDEYQAMLQEIMA